MERTVYRLQLRCDVRRRKEVKSALDSYCYALYSAKGAGAAKRGPCDGDMRMPESARDEAEGDCDCVWDRRGLSEKQYGGAASRSA